MTKVYSTTSTWSEEPGTTEEVIARYTAQGWVRVVEDRTHVLLQHPDLTGAGKLVAK